MLGCLGLMVTKVQNTTFSSYLGRRKLNFVNSSDMLSMNATLSYQIIFDQKQKKIKIVLWNQKQDGTVRKAISRQFPQNSNIFSWAYGKILPGVGTAHCMSPKTGFCCRINVFDKLFCYQPPEKEVAKFSAHNFRPISSWSVVDKFC